MDYRENGKSDEMKSSKCRIVSNNFVDLNNLQTQYLFNI